MFTRNTTLNEVLNEAVERLDFRERRRAKFALMFPGVRRNVLNKLQMDLCDDEECQTMGFHQAFGSATFDAESVFGLDLEQLEKLIQLVLEYLPQILALFAGPSRAALDAAMMILIIVCVSVGGIATASEPTNPITRASLTSDCPNGQCRVPLASPDCPGGFCQLSTSPQPPASNAVTQVATATAGAAAYGGREEFEIDWVDWGDGAYGASPVQPATIVYQSAPLVFSGSMVTTRAAFASPRPRTPVITTTKAIGSRAIAATQRTRAVVRGFGQRVAFRAGRIRQRARNVAKAAFGRCN